MESDGQPRVRIPDAAGFDLYCRRVAGAVGALSIRIFGAPDAHDFALVLGRTLQVVNVLRDVDEDGRDRARSTCPSTGSRRWAWRTDPAAGDGRRSALRPGAARRSLGEAQAGFAESDRMLERPRPPGAEARGS